MVVVSIPEVAALIMLDTDTEVLSACRAAMREFGASSSIAEDLFDRFFTTYYRQVYDWANQKIGPMYAEDVTVATFHRVWNWIKSPSPLRQPDVMLHRCLKLAVSDQLRQLFGRDTSGQLEPEDTTKRSVNQPLSLDDESTQAMIEAILPADDVEEIVEMRETGRELLAALDTLPPHYREAIVYRYVLRYNVAETAAWMGISADQVSQYTARGFAKLRPMLGSVPRNKTE